MTNGILLTQYNQEITQWSPDPFHHERVGSGHETRVNRGNSEYSFKKNHTPAHAVNYYRTFLCERVFDPSDHKQHKFDSFTFTESAMGS